MENTIGNGVGIHPLGSCRFRKSLSNLSQYLSARHSASKIVPPKSKLCEPVFLCINFIICNLENNRYFKSQKKKLCCKQKDKIINKLMKLLEMERAKNDTFLRDLMNYESQISYLKELVQSDKENNVSSSKIGKNCGRDRPKSSTTIASAFGLSRRTRSRCSGVNCSKSSSTITEITKSVDLSRKSKSRRSKNKKDLKKEFVLDGFEPGKEYFLTNPNELKLSEIGLVNNNISGISFRSSKESIKSINLETAKFCESKIPGLALIEGSVTDRNCAKKGKNILNPTNSEPCLVSGAPFSRHRRMRSDASTGSLIAKAKYYINKTRISKERRN